MRMTAAYKEGYRNGYLDRMIGHRSQIALTSTIEDYATGYYDGLAGVNCVHNMTAGCSLGCPGCGMIFDPCEKADEEKNGDAKKKLDTVH